MSDSTGLRRFVSRPSAAEPAGAARGGAAPPVTETGPAGLVAQRAPAEEEASWQPGPGQDQPEKCELCATQIPAEHGHVADLEHSSLMCTCRACYLLFTHDQAGRGRYRAVPDRYVSDPDHPISAAEWEALQVPVGLAFFLRGSQLGTVTGFYPSPAGATECELDLGSWERMAQQHPLLGAVEPDVEAILISRTEAGVECFGVPVDVCYELAGRMRLTWRGFDGGAEARDGIAAFLRDVRGRARPLSPLPGPVG